MTHQERLRQFIHRRGMTQTAAAERMQMAPESLSRIIAGKQELTTTFKGRFVESFGLDAYAEVFDVAPLAEVLAAAAARADGAGQAEAA